MPDKQREPDNFTCGHGYLQGAGLPPCPRCVTPFHEAAAPAQPVPPKVYGSCETLGAGHNLPHGQNIACTNWEKNPSAPAPVLTPSDYLDIVRQPPLNKPPESPVLTPNHCPRCGSGDPKDVKCLVPYHPHPHVDHDPCPDQWHRQEAVLTQPSDEQRELLCQKCGRDYPVWFAPNELWNKVVKDDEHFLCMDCFALTAESRGVDPTAWMLSEENLELSQVLEENRRLKLGLPLGHVTDEAERSVLPVPPEIKRLQAIIERDRTEVSKGVVAMRDVLRGRDWLTEGRGPYEWNDDNWHKEFAAASKEMYEALKPLEKIATDLSDSLKTQSEVDAARASSPALAPQGKWAVATAKVHSCGHTEAQHLYHEAKEFILSPCEIVSKSANSQSGSSAAAAVAGRTQGDIGDYKMIHCEDGKHILMSADLRGSFFDWCQANHVQLTRDQVDGIQNGEIPLVVFDALQMMQFAEYFAAIMAEIDRKVEQAKAMDALRKAIDRYSHDDTEKR